MNINEIKDLMAQFDQSSLREFSYKNQGHKLHFSKNGISKDGNPIVSSAPHSSTTAVPTNGTVESNVQPEFVETPIVVEEVAPSSTTQVAEGDIVESPLVGVVYLAAGPDKPAFVNVGDQVQKGQTLIIIEAMKVMNEVPAPKSGVVTEILVENEEMVEFGKGLVRIK